MGNQKLFKGGEDWWNNAIVRQGSFSNNKWESYASGYKLAAETLTHKVLAEQQNRDTLIYPIIFLYRHYMELRLKEIIEHGNTLLDKDFKLPKHHNLMTLWMEAKVILTEFWPETPRKTLSDMESVFLEFTRYDTLSDSFRYPIDKSGNTTLSTIPLINIRNFADKIKETVFCLEGASIGISVFEDYKSDIIRDIM